MHARFYAPDAHAPGDLVTLPNEEAEHALRVLRLRAGAPVRVFNGVGTEFGATIETVDKQRVVVRLGSTRNAAPEPHVSIALVQAVLKGDKMDDIVRDAVMLGVSAIHPIVTARTEVSLATIERGNRRERWQRIAVSSAKQCGRAVVPTIAEPRLFAGVPAAITSLTIPGPALMLVEPSAATDATPLGACDPAPPREASILVGPEGGWTVEEIEAAAQACRLVSLGARTLRADAMAIVALSAVFTLWKEF